MVIFVPVSFIPISMVFIFQKDGHFCSGVIYSNFHGLYILKRWPFLFRCHLFQFPLSFCSEILFSCFLFQKTCFFILKKIFKPFYSKKDGLDLFRPSYSKKRVFLFQKPIFRHFYSKKVGIFILCTLF